jgi:NAD+ synthase (glutamine-hydrolysing)
MKIALAQLNYTIADIQGNASKIIRAIHEAKEKDADLVVFSELAICGYPPDDLLDYPHFVDECLSALQNIAVETHNITAIVGCPSINVQTHGRNLRNSAFILTNGQIQKKINKTLLPTYDVFNEARYFEANSLFESITINGQNFAVTICEDLWFNNGDFKYAINPIEQINAPKNSWIINLSASPYYHGKYQKRLDVLQKVCQDSDMGLIYVNQVGAHTDLIFDGRSMVLSNKGEMLLELAAYSETLEIFDTEIKHNSTKIKTNENIASIYESLVFGVKDYFSKMGFKQAILGSSGGIDSAVVQALASAALGGENVKAILMPSDFSSEGSVLDAETLSKNLNNSYEIVPISEIFNSYEKSLEPMFKDLPFNTAEENIQARSRAVLLMAISNKFGHILLNTSNKSEMSVGYTTLYGDMCGSLSVIGDLYKTTVYELARFINKDKEIIPINIIDKAPSAELRPNQKDSDSLPEYYILDSILKLYIEERQSADEIIKSGYEEAVVKRVLRMVNNNEYKRFQAPPILKISSKAYGRGRIIPLVSKW